MIYSKDMEQIIEELGMADAEVCIHSSIKSFEDEIENGAEGILTAFLAKNCTVMVPTFSYEYVQNPVSNYMPERNGIDYSTAFHEEHNRTMIFHPDSKEISTDHMGILSKCVLSDPACRRGNHPLNSFTAIGSNAERLTASQSAQDVYAPFRQLYEDDGFLLLMGVELDRATMIHYAEQLAGRKLFIRWANDQHGNVIPVSCGGCSGGFNQLKPFLEDKKERFAGKSLWQCYKARNVLDICKKVIAEIPKITHCGNADCERCNDAVLGGPIIDFVL